MIHRIDRVNPDVDDRVIKPNEARMASNLRFGASTEDTNLSGGTLILGNTLMPFVPPAGINKVVGVYSDLESRNVFFASYNSNGDHGIYRINGETDAVDAILKGSWLNFQPEDEYNVSIAGIGGNLYWTDNVNEPRIVNIEKGIRTQQGQTMDVYPPTIVDWHYAQIKRPPAYALFVPQLGREEVSKTFLNKTQIEPGLQYSYYYIYDNGEESRLAPFSELSWVNYNVTIRIPNEEYLYATTTYQVIRTVVVVVRSGNDGVWKELVYSTTDGNNPVPQEYAFANVLTSIKGSVASDITDARYDSVPLLSKTNEVAQNRLNHANYTLDRSFSGIKVDAKIRWMEDFVLNDGLVIDTAAPYFRTSFIPWGQYTIGVELVDQYGRTFPVSNGVDVVAPFMKQGFGNLSNGEVYSQSNKIQLGADNAYDNIVINRYNQGDTIRQYNLMAQYKISLTAPLPDWVTKVNVVRSKAKNIVKMIQSLGYMFLWYERGDGSEEIVSWVQPQLQQFNVFNSADWNVTQINNSGTDLYYTFKGFVIKFNAADTPLVFEEGMYITLWQGYSFQQTQASNQNNAYYWTTPSATNSGQDVGNFTEYVKFKVSKIIGDSIYISANDEILKNPELTSLGITLGNPLSAINMTPYSFPTAVQVPTATSQADALNETRSRLLSYNFSVTVEKNIEDQIVYTTQQSFSADIVKQQIASNGLFTGYLGGDGFICRPKRLIPSKSYNVAIYVTRTSQTIGYALQNDKNIQMNAYEFIANFISMSPRDIYYEQWNQNIGQLNLTNYKPTTPQRLENAICFSGTFIQGTQTNGLNKFNSLDFRLSPSENGPITSLVTTNATQREPGVLLAIGSFGISSFYYDAIQLTNVDGSNNVATTDAYLASQRPLLGQYGCKRPMSVTKTPLGTVYWWSDVVNDLIRYTNAGLERLGMTFSFGNYLRSTFATTPEQMLITWYDQITDEISLTGKGVIGTATFSERYKTFQGQRDYYNTSGISPERAVSIPTKIYHFLEGSIYVTDVEKGNVKNFIFDSFKDPDVTLVTNESPASVKRWNQVKIYGSRPKYTRLYTGSEGDDPLSIQPFLVTEINPGNYINRKGDWEAAIRRAMNTSGGLMAGKLMESRIIYSNFAFSAEAFEKLNFIEVKSNVSIVQ